MSKTILLEIIFILCAAGMGIVLSKCGNENLGYIFFGAAAGGLIGMTAAIIKNHKGE